MKFILWDTKRDGTLRFPDESSQGILGQLTENNVYLTTYAEYPGLKRPTDLTVGEKIKNVKFTLSSETGYYDIYRIK